GRADGRQPGTGIAAQAGDRHRGGLVGDPHHPRPEPDHEQRAEPDHEQREAQLVPLVDQEVLPAPLVAAVTWFRHGVFPTLLLGGGGGGEVPTLLVIVGTIFVAIKFSTSVDTQSSPASARLLAEPLASTEALPLSRPKMLLSG